jgi:hypothetical protein
MIKVVHPAYHCLPNGGHGSFFPSANRRLSCVLVFATVERVRYATGEGSVGGRYIRRGMLLLRLELVSVFYKGQVRSYISPLLLLLRLRGLNVLRWAAECEPLGTS